MKRIGFAALVGTLMGLILLGVLGHQKKLPKALQDPYNSLVGREAVNKDQVQPERVKRPEPEPKRVQEILPEKVDLPKDDFFPVALIQTKENTHLVYLEQGEPKLVTTSGWVLWTAEQGLVRVLNSSTAVQTLGPGGKAFESRASSSIDMLSRFDYDTAVQSVLFPTKAQGLRLEAEDLENPELAAGFFVRVERRILGFVEGDVVVEKRQQIYMGGAHAVVETEMERIRLSDGQKGPSRFKTQDSKTSFEALRSKENRPPCASIHKGSVGLRGPMGATIAVALAVGELEVCSYKSTLHWEGPPAKAAFGDWPSGFEWVEGKLRVHGSKSEVPVRDVSRLRGLPALLVFSGGDWLPGFALEGEQPLFWMQLEKGLPQKALGNVGPVLGISTLDPALMGARESLQTAQVFGLR